MEKMVKLYTSLNWWDES